jgi:hypothetical protein
LLSDFSCLCFPFDDWFRFDGIHRISPLLYPCGAVLRPLEILGFLSLSLGGVMPEVGPIVTFLAHLRRFVAVRNPQIVGVLTMFTDTSRGVGAVRHGVVPDAVLCLNNGVMSKLPFNVIGLIEQLNGFIITHSFVICQFYDLSVHLTSSWL